MKDFKLMISILSMVLIFIVIGTMLWNKSNVSRIEELKQISDYIVEANFKYMKEQKESEFIKRASKLESMLVLGEANSFIKTELQEIKALALSLSPYNTAISLQHKVVLVDCLEKIHTTSKNSMQCTLDYAKQKVVKGL